VWKKKVRTAEQPHERKDAPTRTSTMLKKFSVIGVTGGQSVVNKGATYAITRSIEILIMVRKNYYLGGKALLGGGGDCAGAWRD